MDARALLEANLDLIERVIRFTARRQRLDESELEEFASIVKLKLIENDYAVIRKFQGRSHLATFITIVVNQDGNPKRGTVWTYKARITPISPKSDNGITKLGSQRLILQGDGSYSGGVELREVRNLATEDRRVVYLL